MPFVTFYRLQANANVQMAKMSWIVISPESISEWQIIYEFQSLISHSTYVYPFLLLLAFTFILLGVQVVRSNAKAANACQNMNFAIRVSDARMVATNHRISVIRNAFRAYSKRCGHRRDREPASIVHFNVEMDDAVRQPSFARDVMDAVITVMSSIAVYAVSENQSNRKSRRKLVCALLMIYINNTQIHFRLSCTSHMSMDKSSMQLWNFTAWTFENKSQHHTHSIRCVEQSKNNNNNKKKHCNNFPTRWFSFLLWPSNNVWNLGNKNKTK